MGVTSIERRDGYNDKSSIGDDSDPKVDSPGNTHSTAKTRRCSVLWESSLPSYSYRRELIGPLPQHIILHPVPKAKSHIALWMYFWTIAGGCVCAQWRWFSEEQQITGRKRYMIFPKSTIPQDSASLAVVAAWVGINARENYRIPSSHPIAQLIESISCRLGIAAGISNEAQEHCFINAPTCSGNMVLPTSDSIVFSGTVNAAMNQNEIAAILVRGHAHMLLQHGREIHSEDTMDRIIKVVSVAGLLVARGLPSIVPSVVGLGYVFVAGPWSRIQREQELDYVSMLLMAEAGFDPKAAASVLHFGKRVSEDHPHTNPYHDVRPLIFSPPVRKVRPHLIVKGT